MEMNMPKLSGIALATAVAGLFTLASAAPVFAAGASSEPAKMECPHSSMCKGQGACKTASNSCKGQNACKGQGFTMQNNKEDCAAAQAAATDK